MVAGSAVGVVESVAVVAAMIVGAGLAGGGRFAALTLGVLGQFPLCFGVGGVALGHGGCVLHSFGWQWAEPSGPFGTGQAGSD